MKALVTGAGGAIGSRLCSRLVERGDEVTGLFLPGEPPCAETGVKQVYGDITRPDSLIGIDGEYDCVFHLAARVCDYGSMALFYDVMVNGTANVLARTTGRTGRFVYMSSIAAYGMGRHLRGFREDEPLVKTGVPYCDTKIDAEGLVRGYTHGTDTSYTIIRPANVLGPCSVWVRDILDAYAKMPVPLLDGGRFPTSFVYVENLLDAVLSAAGSDAARGREYNVCDDYLVTWREYLTELGSWVRKRTGPNIPTRLAWQLARGLEAAFLPFYPARPPISRMAVAVMGYDNDVDTTRAREELGWSTRVPYRQAMEDVWGWAAAHYPAAAGFA